MAHNGAYRLVTSVNDAGKHLSGLQRVRRLSVGGEDLFNVGGHVMNQMSLNVAGEGILHIYKLLHAAYILPDSHPIAQL